MNIEIAENLINDPDEKARILGIQMLAKSDDSTDELLAKLAFDDSDQVAEAACNAILFRQPWINFHPFKIRTAPDFTEENSYYIKWQGLCNGIKKGINESTNIKSKLSRWKKLYGAIPDIIEALEANGHAEIASEFKSETDIYAERIDSSNQVLIAPTYKCNINCSYCYSKGWDEEFGGELTLEDLDIFLNWAEKNNIQIIQLAGGEPTIYSNLEELLIRIKNRGMKTWITSNGMYSESVKKLISSDLVEQLVGHYDQDIISQATGSLKKFKTNLISAKNNGVDLILRYTMTPDSGKSEWVPALELANEIGIKILSYGFSFKGVFAANKHHSIEVNNIDEAFQEQFISFIKDCESAGLTPHQSKPIPLCSISQDVLRDMVLKGYMRSSCPAYRRQYTQNLTVNPDLTTFPCNAIGVTGPKINELTSFELAGKYHKPLLEKLHFHPYRDKCKNCILFYRGFCQGACLAEHYNDLKE